MKTGRTILLTAAAFTAAGGFLFDWNKTHLFNPNWTPHAKFHDAMTIMQAAFLGTTSFYLLTKQNSPAQTNLTGATILPSFFWASMASSFAFPGAKGLEAEFPEKVKKVGGIPLNEGVISGLMLTLLGVGYALARRDK